MTYEEAVADLVRREIRSYRQLPQLIYHLQTKFRDDPRPRAGLIRVREFIMNSDGIRLREPYFGEGGALTGARGACSESRTAASSGAGRCSGMARPSPNGGLRKRIRR